MFETVSDEFEMHPLRRGSAFTNFSTNLPLSKPKKTIYSSSSTERFAIQRSHVETSAGGDNVLRFNQIGFKKDNASNLEVKRKVSVTVDKKKAVGNFFSKLKKKHQGDYLKFCDENSKALEIQQLKLSKSAAERKLIDKLQAKILDLTRQVETKSSVEQSSKITNDPNGKVLHQSTVTKQIVWKREKVMEALIIACIIILLTILLFYAYDRQNFSKSIFGNSEKPKLPKSFLMKIFNF